MVNPIEPLDRIQAAWVKAKGDSNMATNLLSDSSWDHRLLPRAPPSTGKAIGTNVQRAKEKEMGKKSMIYANRRVLESKAGPSSAAMPTTPPPKNSVLDLTAHSPAASPAIALPKRKRVSKVVSDSEESGLEVSDDEADQQSKRTRVDSESLQVLNYFNKRNGDALQELTGMTSLFLGDFTADTLKMQAVLRSKLQLLLV